MAIRTLKIDSLAKAKDGTASGFIREIENGRYRIGKSRRWYSASDLIAEKTTPVPKPRKPIRKISNLTKLLLAVYQVLRFEYLLHNKLCIAHFPGCTGAAKEIHHMYKRTGFWLIISKYYLPICRSCHNYATKHSKEAIAAGVSISRTLDLPYEFCDREKELMKEKGISPP